jgi:hypothetical protein
MTCSPTHMGHTPYEVFSSSTRAVTGGTLSRNCVLAGASWRRPNRRFPENINGIHEIGHSQSVSTLFATGNGFRWLGATWRVDGRDPG